MKAASSGPPSMAASPATSTKNSTIRTTNRCGPRMLCRSQCLLDQRGERQMQVAVCGQHIAARHHRLSAGQIADKAAGLAHQEQPGGDVPRRQRELPEAVKAPGCDIGEVERRRAEPA